MTKPSNTVFITKYALTRGIVEAKVKAIFADDTAVEVVWSSAASHYFHGKDWHRTFGAAAEQANKMREAKLKSLRRQIDTLAALGFKAPVPAPGVP